MNNYLKNIDIKDSYNIRQLKNYNSIEISEQSFCSKIINFLSIILLIITFPISIFGCFKIIKEYERGIFFRLGTICSGEKGPGLFFVNPFIEKCIVLDLRLNTFVIPLQEILSKDSVTVNIDAVVYYQVINTLKAINNVENYEESTKLLSQTVLRNISGGKNLSELVEFKESISQYLQKILNDTTINWGIKINKFELKDIFIPQNSQNVMAIEGKTIKLANAKIIATNGEREASRGLKEAADIVSKNSSTMYLKYLQTLHNIGKKNSTTIIFPLPIDLMNYLFKSFNNTKSN
ncbi:Band 7 protein family and Stomatin family-containing protein [Strongyloides ratti]|uniref:Band 7 protein family and Stomatin family-containing protein n=1 Tax=Strongyloides ratti TaxID=34506 RepID=A0A090LNT8_STRRB|nr:Band 7 protein family and Stomatin family-containing protein [Strongyloides ratti]CEF69849.1 Band 7 protein family and Stomatin family-containing protein [Strongyloides ratti]